MYSGRIGRRHCLFLESAADHRTPDATIHELAGLIEGLSPARRQLWDRAIRREFDIGYETRLKLRHFNRFVLRPGTLGRITALGATLAVTVYREDELASGSG